MLLFLSFFVSVRSNVMFHGLEQYFIWDREQQARKILYHLFPFPRLHLSIYYHSQKPLDQSVEFDFGLKTNTMRMKSSVKIRAKNT